MITLNSPDVAAVKSAAEITLSKMDSVNALIAVAANPAGASSVLQELRGVLNDIVRLGNELAKRQQEITVAQQEMQKTTVAVDVKLSRHEKSMAAAKDTALKIARQRSELEVMTRELSDKQVAMAKQEAELNSRAVGLDARQTKLDAYKAELDAKAEQMKVAEADYQSRISQLKALLPAA